MSSEIEAAGAVVSAALVGAVVDEKRGHEGEHGGSGPCANCGTPLNGNFCSHCGQPAHIHRSLLHMIEEVFHGVIHFDARAWRTLPRLVFQPGKLTYEYIHGRRATYISPLAMFLFVVFVMFFVFSLAGGAQVGLGSDAAQMGQATGGVAEARTRFAEAMATGEAKADGEVQSVRERLAAARAEKERIELAAEKPAGDVTSLGPELATQNAPALALASEATDVADASADPAEVGSSTEALVVTDGAEGDLVYEESGRSIFEQIGDAARSGELEINTGSKDLDKKIRKKLENPELAIYKLQNTAYKFSFLLVPISLPFMWLLFFWKRGVTLFDHCVVVLYSLSFMSLLFVVMSLLGMAPWSTPALVWTVLTFAPVVHLYVQLKGAYRLGIFSALWRTFAVGIFAIVSLVLFLLAIIALGFTG